MKLGYDISSGGAPTTDQTGQDTLTSDQIGGFVHRIPKPHMTWHLDEVYLKIAGRIVYLWRAVDAEGEVLDVLVQSRRNKRAALKLIAQAFGRSMALSQTSSSRTI